MKREHAAIIARARRDGLKPVELAAELMGYTLVEAMRDASAAQSIAFSKMSEIQQDACIQTWTEATKEAIDLAIQVIASAGTRTVRMDLTSVAVGKKLKVAGVVAGTEEYKHDLIDLANDQGTAIVILNERDYLQGLDGIQGEKDQKPLPLDNDQEEPASRPKAKPAAKTESPTSAKAIASKPIELPEKLVKDAVEFVQRNQVCTTAGLQNGLKIATKKAEAVQLKLAELGHITLDEHGVYQIVRAKPEVTGGAGLSFDGEDSGGTIDVPQTLTDELYAEIKTKVIKDGRVSIGALAVAFNADTDLIEEAVQRLQDDSVISEEDEETGVREVLQLAE